MSRLTPTKPLQDAQIESALDILASGQITYAQLSKLLSALTVDENQAGYGPDLDDFACDCDTGEKAWLASLDEEDTPRIGATIAREDQPDWMRAFNDLTIRG